jgi:hypothetical protein
MANGVLVVLYQKAPPLHHPLHACSRWWSVLSQFLLRNRNWLSTGHHLEHASIYVGDTQPAADINKYRHLNISHRTVRVGQWLQRGSESISHLPLHEVEKQCSEDLREFCMMI